MDFYYCYYATHTTTTTGKPPHGSRNQFNLVAWLPGCLVSWLPVSLVDWVAWLTGSLMAWCAVVCWVANEAN